MNYQEILKKGVPNHIAIILDGNGRWAKKRMMPRTMGHRKGAYNLRDIATEVNKIGIKYMTVYCFSTENWNRPKDEVNYLMTKPLAYYKRNREKLKNTSIRIKVIGRRDRLSPDFLAMINDIEEMTKDNKGLTLVLAIDYGSQFEICEATKKIAKQVLAGSIKIEEINPNLIDKTLYTAELPPLDLLIRTSGEIRLSNYLLWQLAYSELYFTDVLWPDFDRQELFKAIESYQNRNRRFGGLKEETTK